MKALQRLKNNMLVHVIGYTGTAGMLRLAVGLVSHLIKIYIFEFFIIILTNKIHFKI